MKTEVLVIGGGATGAGILRDLALRGIDAVLLEKKELTSGTSGRNHGLLHSGARYAVNDPESARQCIEENRILRKIARPCIESTGGLFLSLPEDPQDYPEKFLQACERLGLPVEESPPAEVLQKEPVLSTRIKRAFRVADGSVDPFRLIRSNIEDAERLGAHFFPHREVVAILTGGGGLRGVRAIDSGTGEEFLINCRFIVNAAGIWGGRVAQLAGTSLEISFSKGSLVVLNQRLVNTVINRCRPPSSGDILVPNGPALIIGTTSQNTQQIDEPTVDEEEVDLLLAEGERLIPELSSKRVIRAYAGVRPLLGAREGEEDSRKITRDFLLIDHEEREGIKGLISIIGGKLTTYRLMAERTVDVLCGKMGVNVPCITFQKPLPFPKEYLFHGLEAKLQKIFREKPMRGMEEILCECELVLKEDVWQEIQNLEQVSLNEIQQRTRAGMGPCQGGFCAHRLAALLFEGGKMPAGRPLNLLKQFLEERWKGVRSVLWGPQLKEEQLIQALYTELFNLDHN
jgi:glycerol-3-phosphate dehydrogenase